MQDFSDTTSDGGIVYRRGDVGTNAEFRKAIEAEFINKAKAVLVIEDASHSFEGTLRNARAVSKWVTDGSHLRIDGSLSMATWAAWYRSRALGSVRRFIACPEGAQFAVNRHYEAFLYSQHLNDGGKDAPE